MGVGKVKGWGKRGKGGAEEEGVGLKGGGKEERARGGTNVKGCGLQPRGGATGEGAGLRHMGLVCQEKGWG